MTASWRNPQSGRASGRAPGVRRTRASSTVSIVEAGSRSFLLKLLRVTLVRAGWFIAGAASSARCWGERRACSCGAWASQPTNEPATRDRCPGRRRTPSGRGPTRRASSRSDRDRGLARHAATTSAAPLPPPARERIADKLQRLTPTPLHFPAGSCFSVFPTLLDSFRPDSYEVQLRRARRSGGRARLRAGVFPHPRTCPPFHSSPWRPGRCRPRWETRSCQFFLFYSWRTAA